MRDKNTTEQQPAAFIPVKPDLPTFILQPDGNINRVAMYIIEMGEGRPRTRVVTEKGDVFLKSPGCEIFTSPISEEQYTMLRALGLSYKTYTPLFFDQRCAALGVERVEKLKN